MNGKTTNKLKVHGCSQISVFISRDAGEAAPVTPWQLLFVGPATFAFLRAGTAPGAWAGDLDLSAGNPARLQPAAEDLSQEGPPLACWLVVLIRCRVTMWQYCSVRIVYAFSVEG